MATEVKSHLTGTVFTVDTSVGAKVSEGDTLLVLEAMKMESPLESPTAGTVAEVRVEEGELVEEDQVLVVLD